MSKVVVGLGAPSALTFMPGTLGMSAGSLPHPLSMLEQLVYKVQYSGPPTMLVVPVESLPVPAGWNLIIQDLMGTTAMVDE